jgi:molybdenum cofactor cytidylyltransferase
MTPPDLQVILLAAGSATRFGSPKLLAEIRGRPLVARAIDRLLEVASRDQLVVVLGADADRLEPLVSRVKVRVVLNPDHAKGMATSIRAGMKSVPSNCRGVLIALADQVAVTSDDLHRLIDCWQDRPERISAAWYDDVAGVPAIFPAALFEELAKLQGDRGARELIRRRVGQVVAVAMPSAAVDVDTQADLTACEDDVDA